MLSILDITSKIDKRMCALIAGLKTYGIAKAAKTPEGAILPYNGHDYIGYDDTFKAQLYHKVLSVSSRKEVGGYGDTLNFQRNIYDMAMILAYNEQTCGDLYSFIQTEASGRVKNHEFRLIETEVDGAILDDERVWKQEYGSVDYKLFGPKRLIQINYTITMVFDKNCIVIPNCQN